MVNGAGLAMATMDIIKLAGGSPANFLDVGGGANAEQIRNAFRILLADQDVKAVLINIFGGILRCDVLAEGVIAAVKELKVKVPVVVRMKGNNEEKGKEMLRTSGPQLRHRRRHDEGGARGGGGGGGSGPVSVLVGKDTRLLVQGMGKHGTFHAIGCRDYGTKVVGRRHPRQGRDARSRASPSSTAWSRRCARRERTSRSSSCLLPARRTRSWRRPTRGSPSSCASPKAFPLSTW